MNFKKMLVIGSCILTSFYNVNGDDTVNINGTFKNPTDNVPLNWNVANKKLISNLKIEKGETANTLTITSPEHTFYIYTRSLVTATESNQVNITVEIKGTGKAFVGLYLYSEGEIWTGKNLFQEVYPTSKWVKVTRSFKLKGVSEKQIKTTRIVLGVEKSSVISFKNINVSVTPITEEPAQAEKE